MDYILKSVTANSLVIIDELCRYDQFHGSLLFDNLLIILTLLTHFRSTNANDGQRIAWKICEQLVQINGPKIKDFTENTPDIEVHNKTILLVSKYEINII